ncbi:MAG: GNAT family N-acetyltransferase [Puia sp.]|nr:GNAT family N-acetyltransferase [Puia sp.]
MSDDVEILLAGVSEAGLIADISRRTFRDSFAAQNTKEDMDLFLEKQFSRPKLMAEVGAPGNIFLLAYRDERPAGYACMREGGHPSAPGNHRSVEIARIYAEQWAIGKGVGNALMSRCLEIAHEKAKTAVWLGVWEQNPRAIAFYSRWGFEKFGEHIFVVGEDPQTDWLMRKLLTT